MPVLSALGKTAFQWVEPIVGLHPFLGGVQNPMQAVFFEYTLLFSPSEIICICPNIKAPPRGLQTLHPYSAESGEEEE